MLNLDFSLWEYILLGSLAALLVYEVVFYSVYVAGVPRSLRRLKRAQKHTAQDSVEDASAASLSVSEKGVSVIVCARNEEDNLRVYLQSLLTQDYPKYEVIVVNDGSEDKTREVIEDYMHRDARVRMTFIPRQTTVQATKKLGITLGAKAAQYDYLLLTDADCRPESTTWIRSMMKGFDGEGVELVLGYGAYFDEDSHLNRLINYDTLFNGLNYLGSALVHRPYMGVGRNLAYTKDLFFRSGGFSDLMNYRSGDDDLFVNKVATRTNTAVVVVPESLTWSVSKQSTYAWMQQKRRHLSVSPHYSQRSKLHLGVEPLARGLFYALVLAMVVLAGLGIIHWVAGIAAAVALLIRLCVQAGILDAAARKWGLRPFGLSVIYYDIVLPLIQLHLMITAPLHRVKNRW